VGDSNTIVINTNPIKKVTLPLKGKEYEVPAYMSIHDLQLFSTEKNETKEYKRAISAVISEKINTNGKVTDIEEIYKQDDIFFSEFITAIVENNECIEKIYADTSTELSEIERFGVAYDEYLSGMAARMADAMKPIAESYSQLVKNIDFSGAITSFQESMKRIGEIVSESMSGITNAAKLIASSMEPFRQLSETIGKALSGLHFPNISEEEIKEWKTNYQKWGEQGWTVLPDAPFNLYKEFPQDESTVNKLAMRYCNREVMDFIFAGLAEKKVKKKDLESAIFCYNHRQYKACALLLFGVIDSKLIKVQPKSGNRKVGQGATKVFRKSMEKKCGEEQLLFEALYQINLLSCLDTYFSYGDNFAKEPNVINRNYIDHGMNTREVRKRDCIQLFLATYNLCEIMDDI